jgi:hypothetical protein
VRRLGLGCGITLYQTGFRLMSAGVVRCSRFWLVGFGSSYFWMDAPALRSQKIQRVRRTLRTHILFPALRRFLVSDQSKERTGAANARTGGHYCDLSVVAVIGDSSLIGLAHVPTLLRNGLPMVIVFFQRLDESHSGLPVLAFDGPETPPGH